MQPLRQTNFPKLKEPRRGKVRDIYEFDDYLLIVATDRISAFDVVMDEPIPGKGECLQKISAFWFEKTKQIIPNHFITNDVSKYPAECAEYAEDLQGRSMLVKRCKPLPIECIVRGYIAGSGWKEYKKSQTVCGIDLPGGLQEFSQLPEPIFTPSTKADVGHDENITVEQAMELAGKDIVKKVQEISIALYKFGAEHLEKNNLILADTKFEFGLDENGELILIDEALTPDSSRFWLKEVHKPGQPQVQFDKQILRDYLQAQDWNKQPPAPKLSEDIIRQTAEKYQEVQSLIIK